MRIGRTIPPAASPIYFCDIINGFKGLLRGKREIERFRSEIADYFGVRHCFLVSSGKAGLTLILKALHKLNPERDEVIVPAFCCYSVPSAIVCAGLKVKLCDVDPDTLDFNYGQLEKMLSEYQTDRSANRKHPDKSNKLSALCDKLPNNRLLAILPVHLFGLAADVKRVRSLVHDPAVTVVEDAAQALGAEWKGKKLGTVGDASFFSLDRGKAFSTIEGGIIITNQDDIAEQLKNKLRVVKDYEIVKKMSLIIKALILFIFQHPLLFWLPKSLPFLNLGGTFYDPDFKIRKMSAFQAGLSKNWRDKLSKFKSDRKKKSLYWVSMCSNEEIYHYISRNGNIPDLIRLPIKINDTDTWQRVLDVSEKKGLGIMFTYPHSIKGINELREMVRRQNCPAAERLPRQLLTLPVHPFLLHKDLDKIMHILQKNREQ
jgi:dTDP-4-amino-4,6-dideoxygalactose transaminase